MRGLAWLATSVLVGAAFAGCATDAARAPGEDVASADGFRIGVRPGNGGGSCKPGERRLDLGGGRFGYVRVNRGGGSAGRPLLLALHGAGSGARGGLYAFRGAWDVRGLVIAAPAAQGTTWSALRGNDSDLETVERSLRRAFASCRIDPARVAIGGFSDGATYALTLGLANGRLFRSVIALSGGGILGDDYVGKPRVFVAHGTRDNVLPISQTGDVIVRELREAGYRVTYVRFDGGHRALPPVSRRAVRWFLQGS
jgi:phospholipase/carboxylesterase